MKREWIATALGAVFGAFVIFGLFVAGYAFGLAAALAMFAR